MLFAGLRSVHIVKNCDLGLENTARGGSKLFSLVCLRNSCHAMGLRAVYLRFVKNLGNERVAQIVDKDVLKNRRFLNYFMLAAFISPVKFSKIVFAVGNSCKV